MAYENLFTGRLVLFNNTDKKSAKSPDLGGNIEFTLSDAMAFAEWVTGQEGEDNYAGEKVVKVPVGLLPLYLNDMMSPADTLLQLYICLGIV